MDGFDFVPARTWAEAREALVPGAMILAGGTDLLPNLKHRLFTPTRLVGIQGIPSHIRRENDTLRIGATTCLDVLAANADVGALVPPLAAAAAKVAGPQHRAMATLGGNILLDTRCLYYNQSEPWRKALGYCLKREGTWCHVVGGPKTCVATQSSDTVPVLLALDARIRLLGADSERELPMRALYRFNGMDHLAIQPGELLTEVVIPLPGPGFRGSYQKLRTRDSIDFPQLGIAIVGEWEGDAPRKLDIVVGAINPQPKPVRGLDAFLGAPLTAERVAAIADLVYQQSRPQDSVHGGAAWRRQVAAVFVRRGLEGLVWR
jgi:4-hydroxybenzoyl-CoA reductase subunit beta